MNKVTILSKEVEVLFDELRDKFLSSEEFKNITDEAEKSKKKDEYTDIVLEQIPSELNKDEEIDGPQIPDTGSNESSDEGSDDIDPLNYDEV